MGVPEQGGGATPQTLEQTRPVMQYSSHSQGNLSY